uniref:Uncharacterized protein n=1 Tax=Strigamia maritima TaxID=126957 RepID=T1IX12_STRMM
MGQAATTGDEGRASPHRKKAFSLLLPGARINCALVSANVLTMRAIGDLVLTGFVPFSHVIVVRCSRQMANVSICRIDNEEGFFVGGKTKTISIIFPPNFQINK